MLRNHRCSKTNELCHTVIIRIWAARIIHMTLQLPEFHLCHEGPLYLFWKHFHAKKKCIKENSKGRFTFTEIGARTRRLPGHSRGQQAMKMAIKCAYFILITAKEGNQGRQRIINWLAVVFALSLRELKPPKIVKISPAQIVDSWITCRQMHIPRISKIENRVSLNVKEHSFTNHGIITSLFTRPDMQWWIIHYSSQSIHFGRVQNKRKHRRYCLRSGLKHSDAVGLF